MAIFGHVEIVRMIGMLINNKTMTTEDLIKLYKKVTANECREMTQERFVEAANQVLAYSRNQIKCTCMYCEKKVNYSSGVFTCNDCSK